jgi:hypothetical protein
LFQKTMVGWRTATTGGRPTVIWPICSADAATKMVTSVF